MIRQPCKLYLDVHPVYCPSLWMKLALLLLIVGWNLIIKSVEMVISFLKYVARLNPIYVSGLPVQSVSSYKIAWRYSIKRPYLNSHVEKLIKKANSRLYALRQLKKAGLSKTDLAIIYCSFVRSVVEYGQFQTSNFACTECNSNNR